MYDWVDTIGHTYYHSLLSLINSNNNKSINHLFEKERSHICRYQQRDIMTISSCSILENSKSVTLKALEGDFDPEMISRDVSLVFLLNFGVYYAVKDAMGEKIFINA